MKKIWNDNIFIESWLIVTAIWIILRNQTSHYALLNPQDPEYFEIAKLAIYSLYILFCIKFIRDGDYPVTRRWYVGRFIILVLAQFIVIGALFFAIMFIYGKFIGPISEIPRWVSVAFGVVSIPFVTLLIFCRNRIEKIKGVSALWFRST